MQPPLPLLTPRLALRPCLESDEGALHHLWTTPEVRRYLWDDVLISREQAAEVIAESEQSFAERGFGLWGVTLRGSPTLVGFCGLRAIAGTEKIELLYGLVPEQWGQGLATEAARAVLRYAFEQLGVARVWARTASPNTASVRVMQRLGMQKARDPEGGSGPTYVLAADKFRRNQENLP